MLKVMMSSLTLQYIQPGDAHKLEQAELVVIDEAAAIPLPLVKKLLAPCLVFMASTINGYAPVIMAAANNIMYVVTGMRGRGDPSR